MWMWYHIHIYTSCYYCYWDITFTFTPHVTTLTEISHLSSDSKKRMFSTMSKSEMFLSAIRLRRRLKPLHSPFDCPKIEQLVQILPEYQYVTLQIYMNKKNGFNCIIMKIGTKDICKTHWRPKPALWFRQDEALMFIWKTNMDPVSARTV